jgi:hypothetical protein
MVAVLGFVYGRLSRRRLRFGRFGKKACDHDAWEGNLMPKGSQGIDDIQSWSI